MVRNIWLISFESNMKTIPNWFVLVFHLPNERTSNKTRWGCTYIYWKGCCMRMNAPVLLLHVAQARLFQIFHTMHFDLCRSLRESSLHCLYYCFLWIRFTLISVAAYSVCSSLRTVKHLHLAVRGWRRLSLLVCNWQDRSLILPQLDPFQGPVDRLHNRWERPSPFPNNSLSRTKQETTKQTTNSVQKWRKFRAFKIYSVLSILWA